jgi:hypothetical protein
MLSRWLDCTRHSWNTFVQGWNAFYSVGMLSRVGITLYTVDMLARGLECFIQGWNAS